MTKTNRYEIVTELKKNSCYGDKCFDCFAFGDCGQRSLVHVAYANLIFYMYVFLFSVKGGRCNQWYTPEPYCSQFISKILNDSLHAVVCARIRTPCIQPDRRVKSVVLSLQT